MPVSSAVVPCEQRNKQIFASKELKSKLRKCYIHDQKKSSMLKEAAKRGIGRKGGTEVLKSPHITAFIKPQGSRHSASLYIGLLH